MRWKLIGNFRLFCLLKKSKLWIIIKPSNEAKNNFCKKVQTKMSRYHSIWVTSKYFNPLKVHPSMILRRYQNKTSFNIPIKYFLNPKCFRHKICLVGFPFYQIQKSQNNTKLIIMIFIKFFQGLRHSSINDLFICF